MNYDRKKTLKEPKNFLKNLIEKGINLLIILTLIQSCVIKNKNYKRNKEIYYYKINYSERTIYSIRQYYFFGDTLDLRVNFFDKLGKRISMYEPQGLYIIEGQSLRQIGGYRKKPIAEDIVFTTKKKDSCWQYLHPYYGQMKNCYKGINKDNQFIFSSNQQGADGISRTLYLDKKYIVIKEISNYTSEKFKEMNRINKSSMPKVILKRINL